MNTKLTLSMDKNLVAAAKRVAAKRKTSLSRMIAEFLQSVTPELTNLGSKELISQNTELSPAVQSLLGSIPYVEDAEGEYKKHLKNKHS